jgi:arylsulfatase B/arylsulfatase I/J
MHHLHRIVFCLDILQVVIAKQPNILFILADDFGWNDVGYHGSEIQTPVLDSVKYQN